MNRTGSGVNASRAGTFPTAERLSAERLPAERLAVDSYPRPVLGSVTPSPEPAPSLPGVVTAVTASATPIPSGSIAPTSSETQQVTHWFDVFLGTPFAIFLILAVAIIARFV